MKKIISISDLHGRLADIPIEGDILTISGDICPSFDHRPSFQIYWLERHFFAWMEMLLKDRFDHIVFIAGNHDIVFEEIYKGNIDSKDMVKWDKNMHYLCDEKVEIDGVSIYGTPWTPQFFNWAFMGKEKDLDKKFKKIPTGLDVLLSHGPAYGIGDVVLQYNDNKDNLGSTSLKTHLLRTKPKWHLFGHIHTGNHEIEVNEGVNSVNVSLLNENYETAFKPFEFGIETN